MVTANDNDDDHGLDHDNRHENDDTVIMHSDGGDDDDDLDDDDDDDDHDHVSTGTCFSLCCPTTRNGSSQLVTSRCWTMHSPAKEWAPSLGPSRLRTWRRSSTPSTPCVSTENDERTHILPLHWLHCGSNSRGFHWPDELHPGLSGPAGPDIPEATEQHENGDSRD